uniref:DnaJ protein ERDJ3B isoform X2 n=1 Tax=Rhizophora mucronata TaxID=61149 RepID=A0A2P2KI83_RHIMU
MLQVGLLLLIAQLDCSVDRTWLRIVTKHVNISHLLLISKQGNLIHQNYQQKGYLSLNLLCVAYFRGWTQISWRANYIEFDVEFPLI